MVTSLLEKQSCSIVKVSDLKIKKKTETDISKHFL